MIINKITLVDMQRTFITPTNTTINLNIPVSYIGKQVEVLVYAVDELNNINPSEIKTKRKPSDFAGAISKERATELLQMIEVGKVEWERDI